MFLVFVMLLSVTMIQFSSNINEDENPPIIDYSSLGEIDSRFHAVPGEGECWKILVVPVEYSDIQAPIRYDTDDLMQDFLDDAKDFVEVATYGKECVEFTVTDVYVPDFPQNEKDCASIQFSKDPCSGLIKYGKDALSWEIFCDTDYFVSCERGAGDDGKWGNGDDFYHEDYKKSTYLADDWHRMAMFTNGGGGQYGYDVFIAGDKGHKVVDGEYFRCTDSGFTDLEGNPLGFFDECAKRGDVLINFVHEMMHAIGISGHAAAMYEMCHDIMGSGSCSGPSQISSWDRIRQGWYPNEYVKIAQSNSEDQIIKLRPLNLNLLGEINDKPNDEQIQVLKIPLSSENNSDNPSIPDPKNYLLVEYRPRITYSSSDTIAQHPIGQADNIPHCNRKIDCSQGEFNGLPSEGIMIYHVNENWALNPNSNGITVEPVRVADANQPGVQGVAFGTAGGLFDAAWTDGQEFTYGNYLLNEEGAFDPDIISPYKVKIKIISTEEDATLELMYENPEINGQWGQPDIAITPPIMDGSVPTVSVDIWIDSSTNNVDVDGDGLIDAVYKYHDGDNRTPREGLSDPPAFGEKTGYMQK